MEQSTKIVILAAIILAFDIFWLIGYSGVLSSYNATSKLFTVMAYIFPILEIINLSFFIHFLRNKNILGIRITAACECFFAVLYGICSIWMYYSGGYFIWYNETHTGPDGCYDACGLGTLVGTLIVLVGVVWTVDVLLKVAVIISSLRLSKVLDLNRGDYHQIDTFQ